MPNKSSYDWESLEESFISGDKKLIEYSRERTGFDSSPIYNSLRKRAGRYDWTKKRAEARALAMLIPIEPEKRESISKLNSEVSQLVDAASVIANHLQLSDSLKGFYKSLAAKVQVAIANLDPIDISPDVIIRSLSVMSTLIQTATDLERKSLGLAEPLQSVELLTRYVISRDVEGGLIEEDLPNMSRDEWYKRYGHGEGYGYDQN